MVASATVAAGFSAGMRVSSASTSLRTAPAAAGETLVPTALLTSALMTMLRLALGLEPKKPEALLLMLASSPVPKKASRSDWV